MADIAVTVGVFDCYHEGHDNLLTTMRDHADHVLAIVHDDKSTYANKTRFPVQTLSHRITNLRKTGLVDEVVPVRSADPSTTLNSALSWRTAASMVYIRGDDWPDFPGRAEVEALGLEVVLIPYTKGVSSTQIRNSI